MAHLIQRLFQVHNRLLVAIDLLIFLVTPIVTALILQSDLMVMRSMNLWLGLTIGSLLLKVLGLYSAGVYRHLWRYASMEEGLQLLSVMLGVTLVNTIGFYSIVAPLGFSVPFALSVPFYMGPLNAAIPVAAVLQSSHDWLFPIVDGVLSFFCLAIVRFSARMIDHWYQTRSAATMLETGEAVLIVGAGSAGVLLAREMQRNPGVGLYPAAFIDDDPAKQHLKIRGVEVVGDRACIHQAIQKHLIQRIVIAMPVASGEVIRELMTICQSSGIRTSTLPAIHEILADRVRVESLRDLQIEDLLRREPIQTDFEKVKGLLKNKRVLITGAGGSIGSELCRQILKCQPSMMVLVGKGENSIFLIQQELNRLVQTMQESNPEEPLSVPQIEVCIHDIRSRSRLAHTFGEYQPQVVFHAAAHKHVPLMELNSPEAITSNVMGTQNLVDCAIEFDVEHLVMISTDKAVNPTNVMGASKRVAEMIVLQAAKQHQKPFVVVRFGNVLGSRGSVIPTFKQQIAQGGPITVTDPEICRYFMTIPEAVQLTLQASVLGRSGEVLMLDMGQPVKIKDLAADVIRLAGLEVGKDIEIHYTGLRPGEKLYEELFIPGEVYEPTEHSKVIAVRNASQNLSDRLLFQVQQLYHAAEQNDSHEIRSRLKKLVTGYQPDYSVLGPAAVAGLPAHSSTQLTA